MSAEQLAGIRPEIRREVDSFLTLRADIRRLDTDLVRVFSSRMAGQRLTAAELGMVTEAIERKE